MDGTETEILGVSEAGPDTVTLDLATPEGWELRPGQFVQVQATVNGEEVIRHYSISSPVIDEQFELTVGIDPTGKLSPWLATVEPGTAIRIDGPYGRVFYENEPTVVLLASGPGIGAATGIAERTMKEGGTVTMVYQIGTTADQIVHEGRLAALGTAGASVYITSPERFTRIAKTVATDGQIFVYGFEQFVEQSELAISEAGRDPAEAKIENFG